MVEKGLDKPELGTIQRSRTFDVIKVLVLPVLEEIERIHGFKIKAVLCRAVADATDALGTALRQQLIEQLVVARPRPADKHRYRVSGEPMGKGPTK